MSYNLDRAFTDLIHQKLALPVIYAPLGWKQVALDAAQTQALDMEKGIDYIFEDPAGSTISVQERFREVKYTAYTDFTIRYRRDGNMHAARQESEYFKMKADYFVYGITNGWKARPDKITGFEKFAVVNMKQVYQKIDAGAIVIQDNRNNYCSLSENVITCPVKYNTDGSSSFVPIDIRLLLRLWPDDVVVAQSGFFVG